MPHSEARVATASASRYLTQLCKHWSHKFAVTFDERRGRVPFAPQEACSFEAELGALVIRLETVDQERLTRLENVVAEHLRRFAFREDLGEIAWVPQG